jgi:cytidylate kinase
MTPHCSPRSLASRLSTLYDRDTKRTNGLSWPFQKHEDSPMFPNRGQPKAQPDKAEGSTQLLPETMWADEPMPSGVPPQDSVVVTITRQFGSGGSDIGRLVAKGSGLQYVDQEIIAEVARRLGVQERHVAEQDEQTSGVAGRILEALQASNPFTVNYDTLLGKTPSLAQSRELAYLRLTQKVVMEVATEGNAVIIGRGSQFLLHNAPRTLHIYVFAPLPYRIENVMKQYHLERIKAEQHISQRDREHDNYLRRYYGSDGHQPNFYHLLLNTGLFPFELAANLIQQALPVAREIR